MENNNVEKQTNESNPKSTRKIAIWCCVAAAICLVIATALVMHFRNSDGTIVLYCKAFSANGQYIDFDKAEFNDAYFNYKWSFMKNCAYSTSECIVYSYTTDTTAYGKTWLFTNDEIIRVDINKNKLQQGEKINGEEWYNYSVITFEAGEDGSLRYTRRPLKYIFYSGEWDYNYCWTGPNEFAKEIGYVKIENGKIVYCPEETFTAKDLGYDEEYFKEYLIKGTSYSDLSVEEYFIQQSQRFESAK